MYEWDSNKVIERSNYAVIFNASKLQLHHFCLMLDNLNSFDPVVNDLDQFYSDKLKTFYAFTQKKEKIT